MQLLHWIKETLSTIYIYAQQMMAQKENHHQMAEGNPEKPKVPINNKVIVTLLMKNK